MTKNIVLIGFMGVGKGTTARYLSGLTGMFCIDCDDLIESAHNTKIKKIFEQYGEVRFREIEKDTAVWLEKCVSSTIISTGGGFFKVPNLKDIGTVVYLERSFDNIIESIFNHPNAKKKIKKRPLLNDLDAAQNLYKQRQPLYQQIADISVESNNRSVESVCEEIVQKANLAKKNSERE